MNQDGSTLSTQEITDGYTATKPADPVSSIGKTFSFWTADATVSASSAPFSFSTPITADITLRPVFVGAGLVTMKTGYGISTALKALGANVSPNKTFSASATPPDAGTETQLLSDAGSLEEVKAWCEGTSIKYYAEGFTDSNVKIPLNANSAGMFSDCEALTSLDLSSFNTSSVTKMRYMFDGCGALTTIYASSNFVTTSASDGSEMFDNCDTLVGGAGTAYADYDDGSRGYARIDGGTDSPGYFTAKP